MKECRVHPRIRGEYLTGKNVFPVFVGSPPHTRGIQQQILACNCHARFTPAYAGNTRTTGSARVFHRVHPRIRGEYFAHNVLRNPYAGSPPHTRGILPSVVICDLSLRFTPAYAGNTSRDRPSVPTSQVHPRIRGEYIRSRGCRTGRAGSPPHTRGIPLESRLQIINSWFTPAYAGNTLSW